MRASRWSPRRPSPISSSRAQIAQLSALRTISQFTNGERSISPDELSRKRQLYSRPMPPARTSAEGLERVRDLVARFARNEMHYMTPRFDETSVREQYIDPFFAALGWDVTDEAGSGPLREVVFNRRVDTYGTAAGEEAWDEDLSEKEARARG